MKVGDLVSMIGRQDTVGSVLEASRTSLEHALGIESRRRDMILILTNGTTQLYPATYFEVISESR